MEYKGLWGEDFILEREDYDGLLLVMKTVAKEAASFSVDTRMEVGYSLETIEEGISFDVADEIMDYLDYKNIEFSTTRGVLNNEEIWDSFMEGIREKIFNIKRNRGCVSDTWPIVKMRRYTVNLYYSCCASYYLEANNEDEAKEKAFEIDRGLTREEWLDHLDFQYDDYMIREDS